jgi:hypothetical protein
LCFGVARPVGIAMPQDWNMAERWDRGLGAVALAMLIVGGCSSSGTDPRTSERRDTTTTSALVEPTTVDAGTVPTSSTTSSTSAPRRSTTTTIVRTPEPRLVYIGRPEVGGKAPLDVWSASLDGSDRHILAKGVPVAGNIYVPPTLSADGTALAYKHVDNYIHVRRLNGSGTDVAVSGRAAEYDYDAQWLDASSVVYAHDDYPAENRYSTWVAAADGSGERLFDAGRLACVTQDGRVIVSTESGDYQAVHRDGSTADPVPSDDLPRLCGTASPDGQQVAWSQSTGCRCPEAEVVIARSDGGDQRHLGGCGTYFGRQQPSWASNTVMYDDCVERAIERVPLGGDPVDVMPYGPGFWQFLGVRITR